MNTFRQLALNALKAIAIVTAAILVMLALLAPPRLALISVTDQSGQSVGDVNIKVNQIGLGDHPFSIGRHYFFLYPGESKVMIWDQRFYTAEIELETRTEVLRGDVEFSDWGGFLHRLDVKLEARHPGLRMLPYDGFLTGGKSPEVLAIHPKFRGSHNPLDWLQRQYTNRTGKGIETLDYLSLDVERDEAGEVIEVLLDFSHARGGAVEYIPPVGWPPGNLYRRVLYSMDGLAPDSGYETKLLVHRIQSESPYGMGNTLFYCKINGRYCAGTISTFFDRGRNRQQASVEIWINQQPGDPRVRYSG